MVYEELINKPNKNHVRQGNCAGQGIPSKMQGLFPAEFELHHPTHAI